MNELVLHDREPVVDEIRGSAGLHHPEHVALRDGGRRVLGGDARAPLGADARAHFGQGTFSSCGGGGLQIAPRGQ